MEQNSIEWKKEKRNLIENTHKRKEREREGRQVTEKIRKKEEEKKVAEKNLETSARP